MPAYCSTMSYQNPYGQPVYMQAPSKRGIVIVASLSTITALIGIGSFFVLTYMEDQRLSYTYYEFVSLVDALQVDALIIGGGLLVSVLCAWLLVAVPRGIGSVILQIIFIISAAAAGLIAILAVFVAGLEDGTSFMELIDENPGMDWGPAPWVILGSGAFMFALSVSMVAIIAQYRYSGRCLASRRAWQDPRFTSSGQPQQNTDPHSWNGYR